MNRPELDRNRMPQASERSNAERQVIFTIMLAGERYGLPIDCVRTVFRAGSITPVPLAPRHMIGLINLRGHVVAAVCLDEALGLERERGVASLMVAIEHCNEGYALAVDSVGDVVEVTEGDRLPLPTTVSAARRAVTSGVYRSQDSIIPVLNIEALLGADNETLAA